MGTGGLDSFTPLFWRVQSFLGLIETGVTKNGTQILGKSNLIQVYGNFQRFSFMRTSNCLGFFLHDTCLKDKLERKIWEKPMVCFPMFSWNIWFGFTHNFAVASVAATGILASCFSDLLEFSRGKMEGRWTTMLIHLGFWLIFFKGVLQMGGPYASKMMLIFLYELLHEE